MAAVCDLLASELRLRFGVQRFEAQAAPDLVVNLHCLFARDVALGLDV